MTQEERYELDLNNFKNSWLRTKGCNVYQLKVKSQDAFNETLLISQVPGPFSDRSLRQQRVSVTLVFDENYE
jgi:hypothetical protein